MDENSIRRVKPHSKEAEQSVIGAMLMDRNVISDLADLLTKEDFYNAQYGILYDAMVDLYREGQPVDVITLSNKLKTGCAGGNQQYRIYRRDYLRSSDIGECEAICADCSGQVRSPEIDSSL